MRRMVHEMRSHGWMVVVYNRRGHIALDGKRLDAALGVRAGLSELEAELPSMHRHKLPPPLPEDSDEGSSSDGIFHTAHSASLRPLDAIEAAGGAARGAPVAVALAPAPGGGAGAFAVEPDVAHSVVRAWPLYSDVDDMTAVRRALSHFAVLAMSAAWLCQAAVSRAFRSTRQRSARVRLPTSVCCICGCHWQPPP